MEVGPIEDPVPAPSWPGTVLETMRQMALLLVRSRTALLLVVGGLASGGVFSLVARRAALHVPGDEFFGAVAYLVMFQFGLPVVILYLAVVAVHGDIEDRTVTYLFVRPVRRSALLLGKWLAVVTVGWALAVLALVAIYLGVALPDLPWPRGVAPDPTMLGWFALGAGLASAAYAAAGAAFGALFRRPLIAGGIFVVGWEIIASHTPPQAGIRAMTVADPLRRWLLAALHPGGDLADILRRDLSAYQGALEQLGDPLHALIRFTVVLLLVALWFYTRREYDSRPRD